MRDQYRNELTTFPVDLDDEGVELLLDFCMAIGKSPAEVLPQIVKDMLRDDAAAHAVPVASRLN